MVAETVIKFVEIKTQGNKHSQTNKFKQTKQVKN